MPQKPTMASDSGNRRQCRAAKACKRKSAEPRAAGRIARGSEMNDLLLEFIRRSDAAAGGCRARQAARCGMTRQCLQHLHTDLKVLTVPLLVDWCLGRGGQASDLLGLMEDYVAQGGSIERARKRQTSLR